MSMIRTPDEIAIDATPLSFGKYRGRTPEWISEHDPQYLVWAYGTIKNRTVCSFPLATQCGYMDFSGKDPSARDLPLHGSNRSTSTNLKDSFDSYDDDIPF